MDQIFASFRQFIFRDFFYGLAGSLIFLSVGMAHTPDLFLRHFIGEDILLPIFIGGWCYAIGYVNQEIWSQTPLLTTQIIPNFKYGKILNMIYRNHTGTNFSSSEFTEYQKQCQLTDESSNRIINHKHVGTALAPSLWTVAIIFLTVQNFLYAFISAMLSIPFAFISWLKTMQQASRCAQLNE